MADKEAEKRKPNVVEREVGMICLTNAKYLRESKAKWVASEVWELHVSDEARALVDAAIVALEAAQNALGVLTPKK